MGKDAHITDADPAASVDFQEVQATGQFQELRRRHRSFVFPLAVAFLLWYFLYVLLADYAHDFMSIKVAGNITVGLLFGLLQFVSTFAITMWYVSYANRRLDPEATDIRTSIEGHEHDAKKVQR
ncbi:DUF485 domain-containing protein [Paenarthrobacter sp. DKR-5]|uniref:DUF485 domain-containing protein n=1 Tax=Paenarthrobacter sp. DKR-5 TaxID=2835535 RepID=UPI001BDBD4C4|nr:DUF485 domain-containing protein [Paenarthrobacter sp. DKR-5]MBT1002656.1 DUF485 domain-containing protein [Paenarthrobacter sp. DKR-5]